MTCDEVINGIVDRKKILGLTNLEIAEASNVPKTTVDRILRKETPNPSFEAVLGIANAVGFNCFGEQTELVSKDIELLQKAVKSYEEKCCSLEQEIQLKTEHYKMVISDKDTIIATKDKWINRLFNCLIGLGLGIILVLLADVCVRGIGWFP